MSFIVIRLTVFMPSLDVINITFKVYKPGHVRVECHNFFVLAFHGITCHIVTKTISLYMLL